MNSFAACTYVRAMCLLTETNLDVYAHCLEQYEISWHNERPKLSMYATAAAAAIQPNKTRKKKKWQMNKVRAAIAQWKKRNSIDE